MRDTRQCYIRRANAPWVEGKSHHRAALQMYTTYYVDNVEAGAIPEEAAIRVAHEQGGIFIATFSYVQDALCQYVDEYDNTVHIMMAEPTLINHINHVTN